MACLNFYASTTRIQTPELFSIPSYYNLKPVTNHSISFHSNKSTKNLHSRVSQKIIKASSETMSTTTEKLGIKIVKNPPETKLTDLGVRSWPKWGCPPSKFPWTYSSKETCFLLKGKVKVYPEGSEEAVEFGAGDLVEFPSGMSCTWDVSETVDKHYKFE